MSTAGSGDIDLDLLADYVGGALDGTPEHDAVARLVADDQRWAQAYARLAEDSEQVRRAMARWGADPEPMPPDVASRLSAVLTAQPPRPRAEPAVRRIRRRPPQWLAPLAVAAALLAVVGLGLSQFIGGPRVGGTSTAVERDAGNPQSAQGGSGEQTLAEPGADQILASGTAYARDKLAAQVAALGRPDAGKAPAATGATPGRPPGPAQEERAAGPSGEASRSALAACLRAITTAYGGGTPRFEMVDYARFDGQPALVVVFADPAGDRWAWVVGPECGQPRAGAAARYATRVG